MNKSTPLNQLPAMNGQNTFINDQQRQMVMQAQNAVNALPMPQNTQMSSELSNDDDATIQEVLNQIHGGNVSGSSEGMDAPTHAMQPQHKPMPVMPPQLMNPQITPNMMAQPIVQSPPQPAFDPYAHMQFAGQYPSQPQNIIDPLQNQTDGSVMSFIGSVAEDVKFAAFVFILFIIVHFIPIDKFLMKYFALDKIPYYDIILKATVAFIAVIIFRKLVMKW